MTELEALQAYARMMNRANADALEAALHDDFQYASQFVLSAITSKTEFLSYIRPKLQATMDAGSSVFAEIGEVDAYGRRRPCVVLAQGDRDNLVAIVISEMRDGLLSRLDLLAAPSPQSASRSGVYPT